MYNNPDIKQEKQISLLRRKSRRNNIKYDKEIQNYLQKKRQFTIIIDKSILLDYKETISTENSNLISPKKIDPFSQTTFSVFKNFSFNLIDLIFSYSAYEEGKILLYTLGNRKITKILLKNYQK
jgi:hypothetical protein